MDLTLAEQLNDIESMKMLDPHGIMNLTLGFPDQCAHAIKIGELANLQIPENINFIIAAGLGGSAVGGDYLRTLFEAYGKIPVQCVRDYLLPNYCDENSLVFINSYSGNSEETLSMYHQAQEKGAFIICVTSGGELAEKAKKDGYQTLLVPSGQPPRASLGYMFLPVAVVCARAGLFDDDGSLIRSPRSLLNLREEWSPEILFDNCLPKQIAAKMFERLPIIYGAGYKAIIANRWRCQINENAKSLAYTAAFPELTHNEIVGWSGAKKQNCHLAVVTLKDGYESEKLETRIEYTHILLDESAARIDAKVEAPALIDRLMGLSYLGDFVSVYLAFLNKVDPYEIEAILNLKKKLADQQR